MNKKHVLNLFFLCFLIWAVVVDNAVLPSMQSLRQDVGEYTRFRVKKWEAGKKVRYLQDELMVYAVVKNRERLYYVDYKPHFEFILKDLPPGTPLQLRYAQTFPKFWKKHLYEVRSSGLPVLGYSPAHMILQQREIWKFTGIMGGIFLFLCLVGFITNRKPKNSRPPRK